ncbi:MAG: IS5 family transposase [Candidatus Nitrosocosmicus sp.]
MRRIPDKLWNVFKKILPREKPPKTVGRPIIPYKQVLDGILYVLRTGCQWKMLPKEYGSGSVCHRRFQEWNKLDVFKNVWIKLLTNHDAKIGLNWTWQSIDSISIKSPLGGPKTGNNPTDRSKLGTKRHILTEKKGIPLSVVLSPANTHDIKLVTEVVDKTVIKRPKSLSRSRRRRRLQHLCLDKGYKSAEEEQELIKRGYVLHIPIKKKKKKKKGEEDSEEIAAIPNRKKYSPKRWVVERTNSWHNRFRKLFTRYEKKDENYLGLVQFSCCIIIYRKLILG